MTQSQGIQPGPHGGEATVSTNIHDLHHSFLICVTTLVHSPPQDLSLPIPRPLKVFKDW